MPEKSNDYLYKAIRNLQIADHMVYVTYPLFNEKKLLLKIFNEINNSVVNCIKFVIGDDKWELIFNKFLEKGFSDLKLSNKQVNIIKDIINLNKKLHKSAMEFVRRDKVVIMSDNLEIELIDINDVKRYLIVAKELLLKVKEIK